METPKVNLDRKKISSEEIQQRQDWNGVIGSARKLQPPLNKKIWYYGPAALASVGAIVSITLFARGNDSEVQQKNPIVAKAESPTKAIVSENIEVIEKEEPIEITKEEFEEKIPLVKSSIEPTTESKEIEIEDTKPASIIVETKTQEEDVYVEPKYVFASINNQIGGKVSIKQIEKNPQVELNSKTTRIESFDLTYYNGFDNVTRNIKGAIIPENILREMKISGINSTVHVTKIQCHSDLNGRFVAPSFSFGLIGR